LVFRQNRGRRLKSKAIIPKGMEAVRFPPGEDNRMRRRTSIWEISSSLYGKSEVAKVAPDRAALMGKVSQEMADQKENAEVTRQGRAVIPGVPAD
jgi:hypothetical protein